MLIFEEVDSEDPMKTINILKLCDFGFSKDFDFDSNCNTHLGTCHYIAPEICEDVSQNQTYDGYKADVWSLGVCLYKLLIGKFPFQREGDEVLLRNINQYHSTCRQRILVGDWDFPDSHHLSDSVKDLIRRMMARDPTERITSEGILRHQWIINGPTNVGVQVLEYNNTLAAMAEDDDWVRVPLLVSYLPIYLGFLRVFGLK